VVVVVVVTTTTTTTTTTVVVVAGSGLRGTNGSRKPLRAGVRFGDHHRGKHTDGKGRRRFRLSNGVVYHVGNDCPLHAVHRHRLANLRVQEVVRVLPRFEMRVTILVIVLVVVLFNGASD
jgi:hypothetical protein